MWEWRYSSTILDLGIKWRRVPSRPCSFTPRERAPGTHWIRGWVDPRAVLDAVEKRKYLTLPGLEPGPCSPSLYRPSHLYLVELASKYILSLRHWGCEFNQQLQHHLKRKAVWCHSKWTLCCVLCASTQMLRGPYFFHWLPSLRTELRFIQRSLTRDLGSACLIVFPESTFLRRDKSVFLIVFSVLLSHLLEVTCYKQEVLGRTNRLLSSIRQGLHWKRRVQQFFYCWVYIRYRANVLTEQLPSNDRGHTYRHTDRWEGFFN
jgi:hypothetical protein